LGQAGVDGANQDPIMRAIDSRDEKRLRDELKRAKVKGKDAELLRSIISLRGSRDVLDDAEKLVEKLPEAKRAVENLEEIIERLGQFGVRDFKIDLGIARGLEYYTDFVFELYAGGVQLGGGGRYDELIELLGGEPCPAVGVGFGVDRIARALNEQRVETPKERLDCMVLPAKRELLGETLDIVKELRQAGISVDVDLMGRSLSKAISYADARGARYAAVVGPEDLKAGKITLRDMESGEQRKVAREKLAGELSSG
jgi:histidyl-tRNA synthetase